VRPRFGITEKRAGFAFRNEKKFDFDLFYFRKTHFVMALIEFVCDNTELTAIWGAEAPDIVVTGGFAIDSLAMLSLVNEVRAIKTDLLGHPSVPVKWNMRDLRKALSLHGLSDLETALIERSDEIRKRLLEAVRRAGATIFISILLAYSNRRQVLGSCREDLVSYAFGNVLMRLGLFVSERCQGNEVQIILDWPDGANRTPFVNEYLTGWQHGRSGSGANSVPYTCGALSRLRFHSGPLFGVTDIDERLQLADMIVGASRAFVNYCMSKLDERDFGVLQFRAIAAHLFDDAVGHVFGKGITVAPVNSDFSKLILDGYRRLVC